MPDQHEHPMDQQLRAWATARRFQAGPAFELPPTDRARLQEEVLRLATEKSSPSKPTASAAPHRWRWLVPRLAFALGAAGLTLLAILQLSPRREATIGLARLEQVESPAPTPSTSSPAAVAFDALSLQTGAPLLDPVAQDSLAPSVTVAPTDPAAAFDPPVTREQSYRLARETPAPAAPEQRVSPRMSPQPASLSRAQSEPAPTDDQSTPTRVSAQPQPPRRLAAPRESEEGVEGPTPGYESQTALAARAVEPGLDATGARMALQLAASKATGRVDDATADAVSSGHTPDWTSEFNRPVAVRRNFNAPPDYALRSFRVERHGTMIRLLDSDGSIYEGRILEESDLPRADLQAYGLAQARSNAFPLQVSGTNLSSRQKLIFQGTITTGATPRIEGRAVLGGRDRIVIDAAGR